MIIQGSLSRKKEKDYPVLQTPFFKIILPWNIPHTNREKK